MQVRDETIDGKRSRLFRQSSFYLWFGLFWIVIGVLQIVFADVGGDAELGDRRVIGVVSVILGIVLILAWRFIYIRVSADGVFLRTFFKTDSYPLWQFTNVIKPRRPGFMFVFGEDQVGSPFSDPTLPEAIRRAVNQMRG